MPLSVGARLGPYEIQSAIGAGGMGEVYRARDTRLDRMVAIKILPSHLASRSELRERFEREARTVASLNHPNICTLFDVGHQDGTDFLVMEYLEGETLAGRLAKGALPISQALQYAVQIADALDKAHRAGITHRDLKPGNILLARRSGPSGPPIAKLLDFGLAKLKQEAGSAPGLSMAATASEPITAEGSILGTLQYMSPEQVEGKEADSRSDIFAFGAVVYEMTTGKRAFEGKSQASVMAKILESEPPSMSSLQPMTPASLDRVVKRCLAKDPEDRWQSARDLGVELKWLAESGSQATPLPAAAVTAAAPSRRGPLMMGVGALVLVAAMAVFAARYVGAPADAPRPVTRTLITLPTGEQLSVFNGLSAMALSPDGNLLAYVATKNNTSQLNLRAMDSLDARPVPGTEGSFNPFFSPDGQWLAFGAAAKLKKVSVSGGGAPITLGEGGGDVVGASWGPRGVIVFAIGAGPLNEVADGGGTSKNLTQIGNFGGIGHRWPEYLPDGSGVLFSSGTFAFADPEGLVYSAATREQRTLVKGATHLAYVSPGYLTYVQAGNLMAAPFNLKTLQTTGPAVSLVEGILQGSLSGVAHYSVSATGTLAYIPGGLQTGQRRLVWVNRNGTEQLLPAPVRDYDFPQLSPDGQRIAVEVSGQLWLYDIARDTMTRFTFDGSQNDSPAWTRDGKRILFRTNRDGPPALYWQLADGSGGAEKLNAMGGIARSWSPDGQTLAFSLNSPKTRRDILTLRLSDHTVKPFLQTTFTEGAPQFSPDGRWIAYVSDESGGPNIYVQPYPGPGGKYQISTDAGTEPLWNRNGRELLFRSGMKMMAVDVTTQPTFSAGKPRVLFEAQYLTSPFPLTGMAYDASPDGQRFLMVKETEVTSANQIVVVQNWVEELKRRVPIK